LVLLALLAAPVRSTPAASSRRWARWRPSAPVAAAPADRHLPWFRL